MPRMPLALFKCLTFFRRITLRPIPVDPEALQNYRVSVILAAYGCVRVIGSFNGVQYDAIQFREDPATLLSTVRYSAGSKCRCASESNG